ncbi:hypothetical protein LX81_03959 [Palleronia aestuarii]|uniref:Methyl-accepting chemotaxis protein n=1 Tax=Palleronia aestuarii TaxID=568105 RepID=A0A2W7MTQ7_9RHOB|nr:hypothetical protein [Palleronia aestuarii]PZX11368.1 hypothetical protein LX81_03959 [Palleronia aestuarii]
MTLTYVELEKSLERLSHEIAGAFSIAFYELEIIRSTASEFGTDIGNLLTAVAPQDERDHSENNFDMFLQNAASAAAAASGAAGSLTDRAFQGSLIRISGSLHEMKKHTVALTSISSLTKITQTETQDMGNRLTAFTESLDGRCRELQQATSRSTDLVVETQQQTGLARERLTAIGLEFRALSDNTGGEAIRLAELEQLHHSYLAEIREDANRLNDEVKRAVGNLIGCLQFPDAFAQRSDHVRAAIAAMDKAAPEERAALDKVINAQLSSMAGALNEVAGNASRSLQSLNSAFERSPTIHNRSDSTDPSAAWIIATAQANKVMLDSVARAREQFGAALDLLSGIARQIDSTRENLETSVQLNRELETSVYNASLVAHRSGSQTSPLRFLAGSVKDVVDRISNLIAQISEALTHIRGTSEALAASNLGRDLQTLLEIQESAAEEVEEQGKKLDSVGNMRRRILGHADRLDGASTAGGNAFDAAADKAQSIEELARQVHDLASESESVDGNIELDWLYQLYTMEDERIVHRQALGLPNIEETVEDQPEDLDDFLL